MANRELIVLGTSSQVPTRYRNHNGYFLRWDDEGLLFDPGEGTQRQMVHAGLSAGQITRIFITHFHGDHSLGLAGIIQRISLDQVPHDIEVFYPASGQVYFERLRYSTIYWDQARLVPRPVHEDGVIAASPSLTLEARRLEHPVDTFGYRLRERDGRTLIPRLLAGHGIRGPLAGELLEKGSVEVGGRTVRVEDVSEARRGQAFAFVMDTRPCDGARQLAEGADLLVCESTYLDVDRDIAHEHHHMTALQAATLAREAGASRLVLSHFSQRYPDLGAFEAEAARVHPDAVVARDLDVVEVPRRERPF